MMILAFVAVLLGCAAARAPAPLTCPEQGGPAWNELTSDHFVLHTDLPPEAARAAAARFEQLYVALAAVMQHPAKTSPPPLDVLLFAREADYDHLFSGIPTEGAFTTKPSGDLEPHPTVIISAAALAMITDESFLHALAQHFLHERFPWQPEWLNEGLAQYYATMHIEGGSAILGRGLPHTIDAPAPREPTVWDIIHIDPTTFSRRAGDAKYTGGEQQRKGGLYAAAGKLVYLLMNGPDAGFRDRFSSFLSAVQGGARARDTFLELFGADLPRLEDYFRSYPREAPPRVRRVLIPSTAPTHARERTMSDSEVHLLWARVLFWPSEELRTRARRDLDEALAKEPRSPEVHYRRAIFFLHQKQLKEADSEIASALAARPDDPHYLYARVKYAELKAQNKLGAVPPDLLAQLRRVASTAMQLDTVAVHTAKQQGVAEGLRLIDRAVAVDPLCWYCHRDRAWMLAEAGRLNDALAALDRAMALWPDMIPMEDLVDLRGRLVKALAKQAPGATPAAAPAE